MLTSSADTMRSIQLSNGDMVIIYTNSTSTYMHYINNLKTHDLIPIELSKTLASEAIMIELPGDNSIMLVENNILTYIKPDGSMNNKTISMPSFISAFASDNAIFILSSSINNQITITKYDINGDIQSSTTTINNVYNNYINCTAVNTLIIACFTIFKTRNNDNTKDFYLIQYHLFDSTLTLIGKIGDVEFKEEDKLIFGIKIKKIKINRILLCVMKKVSPKDMPMVTVVDINLDSKELTKTSPPPNKNYASNFECKHNDIEHVFLGTFDPNQFVISCQHNSQENTIQSSLLEFDTNGNILEVAKNLNISNIEGQATYFNSFMIEKNMHVLFYLVSSSIRFQVIGVPRCESYSIANIPINSGRRLLDFDSKIVKGFNDLRSLSIIITKMDLINNLIIQKDSIDIVVNNIYDTNGFSYLSKQYISKVDYSFLVVNSEGIGFKECMMEFILLKCYESCFTCTEDSIDPNDHKCTSCDNTVYYPLYNIQSQCLKAPVSGFVLKDNFWKECYLSCKECSYTGTALIHNCNSFACKDTFYPLYNDSKMCYSSDTMPVKHFIETLTSIPLNKQISPCFISCKTCDNKIDCLKCDNDKGYYSIKNINKKCINEAEKNKDYPNYFLNSDDKQFQPCHDTCSLCTSLGNLINHSCTKCKDLLIFHPGKFGNCVTKCNLDKFNWYIENEEYLCTINKSCPTLFSIYVPTTSQCAQSCLQTGDCIECKTTLLFLHNNACIISCPEGTQPNEITRTCGAIEENCKKREIEVAQDATTFGANANATVLSYSKTYASTDKQVLLYLGTNFKSVIYKRDQCVIDIAIEISQIVLRECINILRKVHNIPTEVPIITIKIDISRHNQPSQIAYQFYTSNGEFMDKAPCLDEKITIKVPIEDTVTNLTQAKEFEDLGVDIYNSSDPFFNDVCFEYTSNEGKDVTLSDRVKNYYQNVSFCEEGCQYLSIDIDSKEVTCECKVQTSFLTQLKDNPVLGEFIALFDNANFAVLKCYQEVFSFSYFIKNIGGWILLSLMILQCFFLVCYFYNGLLPTKAFLLDHIKVNPPKKTVEIIKHDDLKLNSDDNDICNYQSPNPIIIKDASRQKDIEYPMKLNNDSNRENDIMIYGNNNPLKKKEDDSCSNIKILNMSAKGKLNNNKIMCIDEPKDKETEEVEEFTDSELDELMFEDAVDFDKRQFCYIYWNALKLKQSVISSFFNRNPFENNEIKAIGFFYGIAMYFTFNAVFYTESYMSRAFYSKEPFNLLYLINNEISRCLYSSLVGAVVGMLLGCLCHQKYRMEVLIKREKDHNRFRHEALAIIKSMKIRNIIFFIINFITMLLFWYFVSAFCNCYNNTQISWLIGGVMTWGITLAFPFFLCLAMTILRLLGIKCKIR